VAPGLRNRLTDPRPVPHLYLPLGPHYDAVSHIHVRAARGAEPDTLRRRLRDSTRSANTRLAVLWIRALDDARDASPMAWVIRSAGQTFGAFGAIALFMATIGLYGVKAYLVARRTREIGIRMALGAQASDVIRMVVRDGAGLLAAGIAAGAVLAIGASFAVSSLLVGVPPFDPLVLTVAAGALSAAVVAACYVPARRATRVAPVTALRCE
jgi:putative ABC transport system permease protein